MCAPRDQRKSSDSHCGLAELNALRCQRLADVSEGSEARRQATNLRRSLEDLIRAMGGYGMAACGCKTDVRMAFD